MRRLEFIQRSSNFMKRTHRHKSMGDFLHVACKSCGEKLGRSGVYLPEFGKYMCYQPSCKFSRVDKYHDVRSYITEVAGDVDEALSQYEPDLSVGNSSVSAFVPYGSDEVETTISTYSAKLPKLAIPIISGTGSMAEKAREYVKSRGITVKEAWERYNFHYQKDYEVGEGQYFGYIIMPIKDQFGRIVYFQARDFEGKGNKRYINPKTNEVLYPKRNVVFGEENLYYHSHICISEGIYDAIECDKDMGDPYRGTSPLGKELHDNQISKYLQSPAKEIVLVSDDGAFGSWLKNSFKFISSDKTIKCICIKGVSKNGKFLKDVNDLGKKFLLDKIENTPPLTYGRYLLEELNLVVDPVTRKTYSGIQNH